MSRISKNDVHAALDRAAQNISDAKTPDGVVSRDDIKTKLGKLEGTERDLTDIFFRMIDYRDHIPGARVTQRDIDKAVAYAKEKLVDKYDLNHNGLSKTEIAAMSRTGQLAVELARALKAAAAAGSGDAGAAAQKAQAFILANAGDDRLFHDVDGGNVGLHAYALDARDGARLIEVLRACDYNPSLPEIRELGAFAFDPARHAVFGVVETNDETELSALVVDRQTGEAKRLGLSMNFAGLASDDAVAHLVPGAVVGGDLDMFKAVYLLVHEGKELPLPHGEADWTIESYNT